MSVILEHPPVIPEDGRRCEVQLAHRLCGALPEEHADPETVAAVLARLFRAAAGTSPQTFSDLRYLVEEASLYGFAPGCTCGHSFADHIDDTCRGTGATLLDPDPRVPADEPCSCTDYTPEDM